MCVFGNINHGHTLMFNAMRSIKLFHVDLRLISSFCAVGEGTRDDVEASLNTFKLKSD